MAYTHGLANAIMLFLVSIFGAALIIAALNGPFETITTISSGVTTTEEAQVGVGFISTFWDLLPFAVIALGMIQLIGRAALESRV